MRLGHLKTGIALTAKELLRRRIVFLLLLVIPAVFYAAIVLTTTDRTIAFRLASVSEEALVQVAEQDEALIFIGLAAVGLLTSFLALNLAQRHADVNQRLVLCGYRPSELILSKLVTMLWLTALIAAYIATILLLFYHPRRFPLVVVGFALGGFVYGCYGLLVGAVFRRELEGILFVVLLANIDAGWLQNPVYYEEAQGQAIIRSLPAYFPSQVSMVSAFTDYSVGRPLMGGIVYGAVVALAAIVIFWRRTRTWT